MSVPQLNQSHLGHSVPADSHNIHASVCVCVCQSRHGPINTLVFPLRHMRFRGLLHRWEINSAFLHAHKARRRARVGRDDALRAHSHNRSPPASHPCHLQPRRMTHFAFTPRERAHVAAPASRALSISIAFTQRMARGKSHII